MGSVNCGVPQGSPWSPVLLALRELPAGVSYVDDYSWAIIDPSTTQEFQERASEHLDEVYVILTHFGFQAKTEVAWIFASEKALR